MDPAAYVEMRALEDHHWWFRGRRTVVAPLLREAYERAPAAGARPAVLEVGCGTGGNLTQLERELPPARRLGLDLDPSALAFCAERGLAAQLCRADGTHLPVRDASLDCIVALDVVEHCADDAELLRELHRALRPGGQLVLSVPSYPWLWSPHDDFLHHHRRYRAGELEARLATAGFRVERRHGFNFLLLPAIALVRLVKRLRAGGAEPAGSDFFALPGPLNAAMNGLFRLERLLVRLLPIRFGVSLMVRAVRP